MCAMTVFFWGIGTYLALMMAIGCLASRRICTMEGYLVADRKLPFFLAMPTIVATWFGAGSCMGVSGTVYAQGFYGVIADPFACALGLVVAGLFFAIPFHRLKLLTISDLLGKVYGPAFEKVATIMTLPFYIGTLASQMLGMGYIFHVVAGIDPQIGTMIGSLIVLMYTVSGGMWAVTLTDFIQLGLLTMGLLLVLPICFHQIPDQKAVFNDFLHEFSTLAPTASTDWLSYAGRILMTGLGALMGQDLIQRVLASKTGSVARSSAIAGGFCYLFLGLIPLFIGIAGRTILPGLERPELLIPLLAKTYLTPLVFTLFACGLLSAIMSTADSYLLAGTSLITNNVLLKIWPLDSEKKKIRLLRIVNIALALFAFGIAMTGTSIFDLMVHSGAILFVGIFVPASAALFWKGAHVQSAWASLIGGTLSWLSFIFYHFSDLPFQHEDILFSAATFGAATSLTAYCAISLTEYKTQSSQN
jgi:Na+/proline symporter